MSRTETDTELTPEAQELLGRLEEHVTGYDLIRHGLAMISQEVLDTAKERCNYYHLVRKHEHSREVEKNWGFLICRAYQNTGSNGISIDWLDQKPIAKNRRKPEGANVLSQRIPKGRGLNYLHRAVIHGKRKKFEVELFEELEPQFKMLRHLSMLLSKAERAIRDARISHKKTMRKIHEEDDADS